MCRAFRSSALSGAWLILAVSGCSALPAPGAAESGSSIAGSAAAGPVPSPAAVADEEAAQTNALADQARRDVDAFLRLREEGGASRDAGAEAAEAAGDVRTGGPPAIQWIDRPGAGDLPVESASTEKEPAAGDLLARVDSPGEPRAPAPGAAAAASEPAASALETESLALLLVDLRRELYLRKPYSVQPLRELVAIASLSLVDPDARINPEAFTDLTQRERELLEKLQAFFAALGERLDGSAEAEEVVAAAVRELEASISTEPALVIPAATLCWRVGGFGSYEPFEEYSFLAHAERQVILYLEIEGFSSEPNRQQELVTELSQQLEIYSDRDGIPVWSEPWQKAVDVTAKVRRDFFTTQVLTLPKALSVGEYHLKVRVRDEKSGAEAETSVPFRMVADPKLAK